EVLAVAAEPVLVDALFDAMALLQASEYFARSLRRLSEEGFVERKISSGVVEIHLISPELAQAALGTLGAPRRRAIHLALADAVRARSGGEAAEHFLARHY